MKAKVTSCHYIGNGTPTCYCTFNFTKFCLTFRGSPQCHPLTSSCKKVEQDGIPNLECHFFLLYDPTMKSLEIQSKISSTLTSREAMTKKRFTVKNKEVSVFSPQFPCI